MIHVALILTLLVPSVSDRSRATPAFDGVFEFDADLDGTYKLYGDKTDDSNTYIYRSGADEWTMTSGGVDALVCDASYCTFASGPMVGASIPFSDAAGTLTLQNIDALDATTETTIESAIDTLGDISVGSIAQGDDKSVCQGADTDWCCEWDTDGTEGLLCTATDCDGIGTDCNPLHLYQDSGNLIADLKGIDSVTNSSQKITIGPPGADGHSLVAGDTHITQRLEIDDNAYFDGNTQFYSNVQLLGSSKAVIGVSEPLRLKANGDEISFLPEATNVSHGETFSVSAVTTELTSVSGASVTATNLIPAGSVVLGVSTRITVALGETGGTTGYAIGDGSDANAWGDVAGVAGGVTSDNTDWTITSPNCYASATSVVLTAAGGNFDGTGNIRITVHYFTNSAPTS